MALNGKLLYLDPKDVAPLTNALRSIGNNINQIAKKATEINSVYYDDIEKIREVGFTL